MDLRQLCMQYLCQNQHFARQTHQKFQYSVNRWERAIGHLSPDVEPADFQLFRQSMLSSGLSPHSIEQTVYDIKVLLTAAGKEVSTGKPLRKPRPSPVVPDPLAIGKVFRVSDIAIWPLEDASVWWKGFLGIGLWTCLRLQDLLRIRWSDIQNGWLTITPEKTRRHGVVQEIPVGRIQSLLDTLPQRKSRVLDCGKSMKQLRREMKRMCQFAGVAYFTPHDLRRAGLTMWSIANPEAARILHGCGKKDVMQHYLSPRKILEDTAPKVKLPDCMLPADLREQSEQQEEEMLAKFRNATPEQRELLIKLSRQLG